MSVGAPDSQRPGRRKVPVATPASPEDVLRWTSWLALEGCWRGTSIPALPGLYRIRRSGRDDFDYIGQTGMGDMTLRKRLGTLRGVYAEEMPYRDPHTAGPALWALRRKSPKDIFVASVAPVAGDVAWRKGWECVAIALYRQEHGLSPTVEFGRMPPGYRMSSGNNARLIAGGKRWRGGSGSAADESHLPSIAPAGPLGGDPQAAGWCGHRWSAWAPIQEAIRSVLADARGLYRLRATGTLGLIYIGQGAVRARLAAHRAKAATLRGRQGVFFAGAIECLWVLNGGWYGHQRLELENDLIGAYLLATGEVPPAQFRG
jgi:hypothetical protein